MNATLLSDSQNQTKNLDDVKVEKTAKPEDIKVEEANMQQTTETASSQPTTTTSEPKKRKKKKKKEKKKKKKTENGQQPTDQQTQPTEQDKSKGYLGFPSQPRKYSVPAPKKKQTDPPTIPISQQYPSGNFPTGEFMDHPGDLYVIIM
jgi:hypothetical protein